MIGFGGVSAEIPIYVGTDGVLRPGEQFTHTFDFQLAALAPFDFFVNVLGVIP